MSPAATEELHDLFQVRDALQLLCDRGYDLGYMLTECEQDIQKFVNGKL